MKLQELKLRTIRLAQSIAGERIL